MMSFSNMEHKGNTEKLAKYCRALHCTKEATKVFYLRVYYNTGLINYAIPIVLCEQDAIKFNEAIPNELKEYNDDAKV